MLCCMQDTSVATQFFVRMNNSAINQTNLSRCCFIETNPGFVIEEESLYSYAAN